MRHEIGSAAMVPWPVLRRPHRNGPSTNLILDGLQYTIAPTNT